MKVSIIIPVYNVAPYIEACLKSVMRQTYGGLVECVIVDDCGTDDSIAIAERMIDGYEGPIQFRTLHHEYSRGLSAARNTGTIAATGDYIYYLDSDDEISEDCIEKLMAVALHDPDIEMVQGNGRTDGRWMMDDGRCHTERDPYTKVFPKSHVTSNEEIRSLFYHKKIIQVSAWNKLIKRSFLTDHHLSFKEGIIFEDQLWFFFTLKYLGKVSFVSDITYIYKRRPGSIITGTDKQTVAYHRCIIFQDVIAHLTPSHKKEEYRYYGRGFAPYYRRYARCLPAFRETFPLYWRRAWQLKCYGIGCKLAVSYVLGRFKGGDKVYECLRMLKGWGALGISRSRALSGMR